MLVCNNGRIKSNLNLGVLGKLTKNQTKHIIYIVNTKGNFKAYPVSIIQNYWKYFLCPIKSLRIPLNLDMLRGFLVGSVTNKLQMWNHGLHKNLCFLHLFFFR